MAITSVKIISEDMSINEGVRTATRTYQVIADSTADTVEGALTATDGTASIPAIGDAFATGSNAKAKSKKANYVDNDPYVFQIEVQYTSATADPALWGDNPLNHPTQYSYGESSTQEPYFRDTADLAVVNSAGEPFAQMPTRDASSLAITITKNVGSFGDPSGYYNKINSAAKTINGHSYAARTLRIKSITGDGPHYLNGFEYWKQSITVLVNPDTWDQKVEDRGLNELDTGKLVPILDGQGQPVVLPWPLDGSGGAKANSTDAPAQATAKPYTAGAFPSLA